MENANLQQTPETYHKTVADKVLKEKHLNYLADQGIDVNLHKEGYLHFHQLEYFYRPNCLQHKAELVLLNGLDFNLPVIPKSSPAKYLSTALQHLAKMLIFCQTNMAGGQSIDFFNLLIAPYARDLNISEIKQALQMFIYELNQMFVARGGQTIFSNINIELSPELSPFIDKEIVFRGEYKEVTYEEFLPEIEKINRILFDLLLEGDATGKIFLYPITILKFRNLSALERYKQEIINLVNRNANVNFANLIHSQEENVNFMGCRTRLAGDLNDTLGTGNLCYTTVNLPLVALKEENIFSFFRTACKETKKFLDLKKKYILERDDLPLLYLYNSEYYNIEKATYAIGFIGLYTALEILQEDYFSMAEKYLKKLNRIAAKYNLKLSASPAEGCSNRFLEILRKNNLNIDYLPNSYHLPVDYLISLKERIRVESRFSKYCPAGNIIHLYSYKENYLNPEFYYKLIKEFLNSSGEYLSISKITTFCPSCNKIYHLPVDICPKCKTKTKKIMKITGYLADFDNFNYNKKKEAEKRGAQWLLSA